MADDLLSQPIVLHAYKTSIRFASFSQMLSSQCYNSKEVESQDPLIDWAFVS